MYSRYPNYQPFDPLQNMLSRTVPESAAPAQETAVFAPAGPAPVPEALPAAGSNTSGNFLESLGKLGNLGNLGGLGSLGGLGALSGLLGGGKGSQGLSSLLGKGGKGIAGLLDGGIGGLLKNLSLNWDSGDILLALILLFLSMESDDEEIILLLGLMLFFGLD